MDGWSLRQETEEEVPGKVLAATIPCGTVQYAELAEMVTTAYSEPENRNLPVGWVMLADIAIECGRTTSNLVFPALRAHLAKEASGSSISPIDTINSVSTSKH